MPSCKCCFPCCRGQEKAGRPQSDKPDHDVGGEERDDGTAEVDVAVAAVPIQPYQFNRYRAGAEACMDFALIMANISQLRVLMNSGDSLSTPHYVALLSLIVLSLTLQTAFAVILIIVVVRGGDTKRNGQRGKQESQRSQQDKPIIVNVSCVLQAEPRANQGQVQISRRATSGRTARQHSEMSEYADCLEEIDNGETTGNYAYNTGQDETDDVDRIGEIRASFLSPEVKDTTTNGQQLACRPCHQVLPIALMLVILLVNAFITGLGFGKGMCHTGT
ncbi:hypothetical protein BaRGS_00008777 [Batillaria attramentaria]|uniref:Uncharacterized protein n=1 Tax=Batillaria attramentaria TaxID=370345 RepID=A0ABD0LLN9_9CAEN